jgi:hypothetical protein
MVSHFIWLYERSNLLFFTLMGSLYKTITSPCFCWRTGNCAFLLIFFKTSAFEKDCPKDSLRRVRPYNMALPSYVADFKIFSATFTADFESGA